MICHTSALNGFGYVHLIENKVLGETEMTKTNLIVANLGAWSLAFGIWAINLGVFEASVQQL